MFELNKEPAAGLSRGEPWKEEPGQETRLLCSRNIKEAKDTVK